MLASTPIATIKSATSDEVNSMFNDVRIASRYNTKRYR
jgi:hypothetical protein